MAYVVLAHKGPRQLGRLVRALEPQASPVLVHVDARTPAPVYAAMRAEAGDLANVSFLPRHPCRWAGFGVVAGTLEGIAAVVERRLPADHVVLMSGQDYPVKPPEAIRSFLAGHREESFMMWERLPRASWGPAHGGLDRVERYWLHVAGRHVGLPLRRRIPGGWAPYGGLAYWCLSRAAVEWVHAQVSARPELVAFFRHVAAPDELFFQTLLLNGPLAGTVRDDPLRWVDFPPGAARPRTFTVADLPALAALPPNGLWARKFDLEVDAEVLDGVDALIGASADREAGNRRGGEGS